MARTANDEGLCISWLWENLKKNTKVVVWDDDGRTLPYPDDDLEVYYNPDGGTSYHATATCRSVRDKYLPLTAFTYGELDSGKYASLTGCTNCIPVKRRAEIDEINQERIDLGELLKNPVYTGGATTGGGAQAEGSAEPDSPEASDGVTITIR